MVSIRLLRRVPCPAKALSNRQWVRVEGAARSMIVCSWRNLELQCNIV
jgi:hypothetical protein